MVSSDNGYTLIDSGDGAKLEKFGNKTIVRPSSLCAWRRRCSSDMWRSASATLSEKGGWIFSKERFNTWNVTVGSITLELLAQPNGQIGIFPEHASYLPVLEQDLIELQKKHSRPLEILNLFAYTGLATLFCAKSKANACVTHVDLAKKAIEWARRNATLNNYDETKVRFIVDDALGFMAREGRKQHRYDAVILDPPSFSRVSKNNTWTLEEKLPEIVNLCLGVLNQDAGVIYLTNHSSVNTVDIARNMLLDHFNDRDVSIETRSLSLQEDGTQRVLPAGALVRLAHGI